MTVKKVSNIGWLARQSMSLRVVLTTLVVTVLVMAATAGVLVWQTQKTAEETVRREMNAALTSVDQSLQLVFNSASQRGRELMPAFIKALGGEPLADGTMIPTGSAGEVYALKADGRVVNGEMATLEQFNALTGADPAIFVRSKDGWVRAATLLKGDKGQSMVGSVLSKDDPAVVALSKGQEYAGLVMRYGKWYAMNVRPLYNMADASVVGALSIRVDVDADVQRLLAWVGVLRVGDYGSLSILQRAQDGKGWSFVAGGGAMMGAPLSTRYKPNDIAVLESLFTGKEGNGDVDLQDGGDTFVAWRGVENWNWLLVGSGQRSEFMAAGRRNVMMQLLVMLVGTLVIAGLVGWLASATLRPVRDMIKAMVRVGQGDLTVGLPEVPTRSRNEVHVLFGNLRQMQENLRATVRSVRRSVEEIRLGSSEIAMGNMDLSSRTEQQAASLQETAASLEELASTVRQNADNSGHASRLAANASEVAERGGATVGRVVSAMDGITASSGKISDIVTVIEGIAFQTNILALNAAVEAARAGEEGKGFAVVAGEVRSLALRCAEAAKEIKQLIDESAERVAAGTAHVSQAGATMQEVLGAIRQVSQLMEDISSATNEQSTGIDQVNTAVVQMDQVTQQNAALVQQAAAAAGSLQDQVGHLTRAVAVFRLEANESASQIEDESYAMELVDSVVERDESEEVLALT